MKKILFYGLFSILVYIPGIYAERYTVTVVNNTGAAVDATVNFSPYKCGLVTVTVNNGETKPINVDCCYLPVKFKVKDGRYAGKTTDGMHANPRVFHACMNSTFTLEIKNGALTATRK